MRSPFSMAFFSAAFVDLSWHEPSWDLPLDPNLSSARPLGYSICFPNQKAQAWAVDISFPHSLIIFHLQGARGPPGPAGPMGSVGLQVRRTSYICLSVSLSLDVCIALSNPDSFPGQFTRPAKHFWPQRVYLLLNKISNEINLTKRLEAEIVPVSAAEVKQTRLWKNTSEIFCYGIHLLSCWKKRLSQLCCGCSRLSRCCPYGPAFLFWWQLLGKA